MNIEFKLEEVIDNVLRNLLNDKKYNTKTSKNLIHYFKRGPIRKPNKNKIMKLLKNWNIDPYDLTEDFGDFIKFRDNLIHRGELLGNYSHLTLYHDKKGKDKDLDVFHSAASILIRIFLSMLKYRGEYYDP